MVLSKQHKLFISTLGAVLLVAAIITALVLYQKQHAVLEETVAVFSNQPGQAPYTDLAGNPVSLEEYLGRVLVVASWASWSPFSEADLSMLKELSKKYSNEEVVFMAINRKETKEQAGRYLSTLDPLDGLIVVLDPRDNFYLAVEGYAMPEVVIYNERGEIVVHERGTASRDIIEKTVDELISGE
jgi:thiol-disulfide isomerase/thioredoxin